MARLPGFDPFDYLLRRRFDLNFGTANNATYCRWLETPRELNTDERRFIKQVKTYLGELEAMTADQLSALVEEQKAGDDAETKRRAERESAEKESRHPFNNPPVLADESVFNYWSKAPYWERDEAAALLLGRNPKFLDARRVKDDHKQSQIGARFLGLALLLSRAVTARQIKFTSGPGAFLAWAKRHQIEYPAALEAAILRHGHELVDWQRTAEEQGRKLAELGQRIAELEEANANLSRDVSQSVGTRERDSLLKLVIGMAVTKYRYKPGMSKNEATKRIADDLQILGIGLDDDTVRRYLSQARELLPGDASAERPSKPNSVS